MSYIVELSFTIIFFFRKECMMLFSNFENNTFWKSKTKPKNIWEYRKKNKILLIDFSQGWLIHNQIGYFNYFTPVYVAVVEATKLFKF